MNDKDSGHETINIGKMYCPYCEKGLSQFLYLCDDCFTAKLKEAFEAGRINSSGVFAWDSFEHWMELKKFASKRRLMRRRIDRSQV